MQREFHCAASRDAVGWKARVRMLPFKLIYTDGYDLNLGAHVFPSQKYRMVRDRLLREGIADASDFIAPPEATDEDVLRVHTPEYVRRLKTGALSRAELQKLEVPYSRELITACWLGTGGSILAGHHALEDGWAANIGGGFHHAYPDHGEGFCVIHDVAIAIRRLQAGGAIQRAIVVDTDVHQGNGTAAIFRGDGSVFTLSIHQENNYPYSKPASTLDINLEDGVGDDEYLDVLDRAVTKALAEFDADILFYVAGADPYREDQLGGLALTLEGLAARDALVCSHAKRNSLPLVTTFAGGYAPNVGDTVKIHCGTILAMRDAANA
jgi:acetoin utilization deacetylase AcuC-like enzyme